MKKTLGVVSLGCPRNVVDTESILGRLAEKGFSIVDIEQARVVVVNTCAFIEEARRESIDVLLDLIELKKQGKIDRIIVYGCLVQRYAHQLREELPEIDAFVGRVSPGGMHARSAVTARHFAYLKICEGCVNLCGFCVIPRIKGKLCSVPKEELISQARRLDAEGIAELNIIGQDITGYGLEQDGGIRLPGLLAALLEAAPHIPWMRLLYMYPSRIDDDLIAFVADEPRVCNYFDIPIQHCSDRLLSLMNRSTTKRDIIALIEKIRHRIPGAALRTAVITGLPTETDEEFEELLRFVEEYEFERLGAFVYSPEEGTPAFELKPQVPLGVRQERFDRLMALQQEVAARVNARLMGRTMKVLVDEAGEDGVIGRTYADAPEVDGSVYVETRRTVRPGDFLDVRITDTMEYDLKGVEVP